MANRASQSATSSARSKPSGSGTSLINTPCSIHLGKDNSIYKKRRDNNQTIISNNIYKRLKLTRMTIFIDQTNIDKYRVAANITEYHIILDQVG